jgi:hypothetical protein
MGKAEVSQDEIDYALSTLEFFHGDVKACARFLQMPAKELQQWAARAEQSALRASRTVLAAALRPRPPALLLGADPEEGGIFVPSPDLSAWMQKTFVVSGAPLLNPDHEHLEDALIGVLWTNVANTRSGKMIAGTAEMPYGGTGSKWGKARAEFQLRQWFGPDRLDFLIVLDAEYADQCDDATFCSLCEHEMYHCAQKTDLFGAPAFSKSGSPLYTMKGHDAEEFVGVVARYGVGAAAGGVPALVAAGNKAPSVAAAKISSACGTCRR